MTIACSHFGILCLRFVPDTEVVVQLLKRGRVQWKETKGKNDSDRVMKVERDSVKRLQEHGEKRKSGDCKSTVRKTGLKLKSERIRRKETGKGEQVWIAGLGNLEKQLTSPYAADTKKNTGEKKRKKNIHTLVLKLSIYPTQVSGSAHFKQKTNPPPNKWQRTLLKY